LLRQERPRKRKSVKKKTETKSTWSGKKKIACKDLNVAWAKRGRKGFLRKKGGPALKTTPLTLKTNETQGLWKKSHGTKKKKKGEGPKKK